jgi:hypothetical protein
MGLLGDFLEVVYGPASPFQTLRATIRQWCNESLAEAASGGGRPAIGRRKSSDLTFDEPARIKEVKLSVWINLPNRYRIEKTAEDRAEQCVLCVNGEQQWTISQGQVKTSQAKGGMDTDLARHFDHPSLREYFVSLSLQPIGDVKTAERNCLRLRAVPRPGSRLWPHWLPCGADEYEFHADLERGVLLYIAGRCGGEIFAVHEVVEVHFDEPLDETLFTYSAAEGQQVEPEGPLMERLTMDAVIARVPFTVLVPSKLPDAANSNLEITYTPPRNQSGQGHLTLIYPGHSLWITESETADPDLAQMEWEAFEHAGQPMRISDPGADAGMRIIALERLGTQVSIFSNMGREQLIELAVSLRSTAG